MKIASRLLLLILGSSIASWAQTTQQFTGHVFDSTGAVIQEAQVLVHNQGTGVETKTTTTEAGVYTVPYLQPGIYSIRVSMAGFKSEEKTNIELDVDQTSTMDFHLAIGTTNEVLIVNSRAAQIELSKADRGEIIDNERVNDLPLDGRNPYGLVGLSPGEHDFSNAIYPRPYDHVTNNQYANGSPQVSSLSLDGISNDAGKSDQGGFATNPGIVPSLDVVQEFKVVTGAVDASYGRGGGSSVDVAIKSGTNQYHGVADYYKRAPWLDTYAWTNKWSALTNGTQPSKVPHKRDQFSVELDGPVIIPHLYNGKKKLFFTVNYEELLDTLPNTSYNYYSIPNPAWVKGDFSTAQYWNQTAQSLMPLKIYDPLTPLQNVVDPNDHKTKLAHSQFPGNIVPANRIDPVGQALLAELVQVIPNNNPGPGYAPYTNNYKNLQVEDDTWLNALIRVDYVPNDADRLSFRWGGQGRWIQVNSLTGYPKSLPFNMNGVGSNPQNQTGAVEWTHILSPNLLFDLHASLMTQANVNWHGPNQRNWLQKLGFAQSFYSQAQDEIHFPYVAYGGLPNAAGSQLSYSSVGGSLTNHALDFLPTLTWIHGQHSIRAGFDVQLQQSSNPLGGSNDSFSFTNNFTNEFHNYSEAPGYSSGTSYASGLLGYLNGGTIPYNLHYFVSRHYFAPWVQDDWKVTRNLTLNLGFRWDFQTPSVIRDNKMDGIFNIAVVNPVTSQLPTNSVLGPHPVVMGGMEFAGVNGQPLSAYAMNWYDWQPRIGAAYAIRANMSIRGYFAKNYLIDTSLNGTTGFSASTSYVNSLDGGLTPYTATTGQGLTNPIPVIARPVGSTLGYLTNVGQSMSFVNPKYHIPSLWSYGMTFETAVTKHDVVSLAYVGNIVPDGAVNDNINHQSASFLQQCNGEAVGFATDPRLICDNNSLSNTAGFAPNPFLGVGGFNNGSSYYSATTISRADLTRPYVGYGDVTEVGATNNNRSWYNSLQATAKHQVSTNLSLFFNYTHATDMSAGGWRDTTYRIVSRQVSTTNQVKHAMNVSGVAYLPFGKNRAFFSNVNRWVDEAINGWQVSPLFSYYSGFSWRPSGTWEWNTSGPMGIDKTALAADSSHNFRRLRGVTPCVGSRDPDKGTVIPSPAATAAGCSSIPYVLAASYAVPTNVIDFGVKQPGAIKFDAAAAKNFSVPVASKIGLSENTSLQLRLDMLNVPNHANWDMGYNGTPSSLDWGTISKGPSGPSNPSRFLQLSARLSW